MIHLISDLFDPSMGSEFQVPQIALKSLARQSRSPITLWTTRRGNNENEILRWLKTNGLDEQVNLNLVDLRRADAEGNHRSQFQFALDLILLYKTAVKSIQKGDFVWKCGQANFLFNLWALVWIRVDLLGPITGLEIPPIRKSPSHSIGFRVLYTLYSWLISLGPILLKLVYKIKRFKYLIVATSNDYKSLPHDLQAVTIQHTEADLDQLIGSEKAERTEKPTVSLLWAGSFIERKNPILAFEIFKKTLLNYPNLNAVMIGEGPLRKNIEYRLLQLSPEVKERISIKDPLSRKQFLSVLPNYQILLVTSIREANSVMVLEALAADLTVVSTAVSGMKDKVEKSGYLYQIDGQKTMGLAMESLDNAILNGNKYSPRHSLVEENVNQTSRIDHLLQSLIK